MKNLKILVFVAGVLCYGVANSQPPDSCLKLLGNIYGDTTWVNPDSIRVDSCAGSPTFGHRFA
jgi:hypothetical protein